MPLFDPVAKREKLKGIVMIYLGDAPARNRIPIYNLR